MVNYFAIKNDKALHKKIILNECLMHVEYVDENNSFTHKQRKNEIQINRLLRLLDQHRWHHLDRLAYHLAYHLAYRLAYRLVLRHPGTT